MAMNELIHRIRDKWYNLNADERKKIAYFFAIIAVVILLFAADILKTGKEEEKPKENGPEEPFIPKDLIGDDLQEQINAAVQEKMEEMIKEGKLNHSSPSPNSTPEPNPEQLEGDLEELNFGAPPREESEEASVSLAPVPPNYTFPPSQNSDQPGVIQDAPVVPITSSYGGINTEQVSTPSQPEEETTVQTFTVPPGLMPAKMLVGVHALVTEGALSSPKPIHFRVQAPAILPNKIKLNLMGCFVIANVWGNLASERIETELVSIHCITSDRKTLIEGRLKGYIADGGQRDIEGRVVTKAGPLLFRQFFADFLAGAGSGLEQQSSNTSITALGSVAWPAT